MVSISTGALFSYCIVEIVFLSYVVVEHKFSMYLRDSNMKQNNNCLINRSRKMLYYNITRFLTFRLQSLLIKVKLHSKCHDCVDYIITVVGLQRVIAY